MRKGKATCSCLAIAVAGLTGGCSGFVPRPVAAGTMASTAALAKVEAHTVSAQTQVQHAMPHSDGEGKAYLAAASSEHEQVLEGAGEAREGIQKTQEELTSAAGELTRQKERYVRLEEQWYVCWGRRIERAFWTVAMIWLAGGILSLLTGIGNPLTLLLQMSRRAIQWLRAALPQSKGVTPAAPMS